MSDANLNQLWARVLVEELVRGGVRHAVVCPGSRSSPLALACAQGEGLLKTWSVIDERSAGFFALGLAKQSRSPVVLVATSGTAGAHFYPAVIEAAMANVPLVVLTADRPLELQGWGAPQTVPQARFFGDFARLYADVGLPEASDVALVHLRATVARAVVMAMRAPKGAVQLNVPFREPLAPVAEPFGEERLSALVKAGRPGAPMTRIVPPAPVPDPAVLESVRARIAATERGVIVCGPRDEEDGFAGAIAALAEATGYPVLAEAASAMVTAAGLQGVEVHTPTWTAPDYQRVAEGIAGAQWALYLRVLWEGTALAERATALGRALGVAAHVAEDIRSGDPRFHGMPEEDRREVLKWAQDAATTVGAEGLESLNAVLRTVEPVLGR